MNNIDPAGGDPYRLIPNRLSPLPLPKEAPSTTPDKIVSFKNDQFISNPSNLGNLVASSGLVKLPGDKKKDDIWDSFAVPVEPEAETTNANAVLPLLNMKPGAPIKLTELFEGKESVEKESVMTALIKITGSDASKVSGFMSNLA
jgi:hypothetical protein